MIVSCAADCAGWAVERREEAIAGGVHLDSAEPIEQGPNGGVMPFDEAAPRMIAHRCGLLSRSDDVSEQDGREHAIQLNFLAAYLLEEFVRRPVGRGLIAEPDERVMSREVTKFRAGN